MDVIDVTFDVLKFEIFNICKYSQSCTKHDISLTLRVSNPDKSRDVSCLQELNIEPIVVTDDVSKFDKSTDVILSLSNIKLMSVTADVSTVHTSIDVKLY